MARGKKKESLTLEEKLEAALVPEDEQPYEVPGNWCWVKLLSAFENLTDSKKKIQTKQYEEVGAIPIIDQGQEFIGGFTDDDSLKHDAELPVIVFGDHTRCVKYIDFSFAQGADGVKVLKPYSFYDSKAFYYALQSIDIPNMGYRRHYPLFKNFSIPLPPLPEQHRIVERIESLFSQLDEARDKAQEALDSFDIRKSSLLQKAFSGELTEKWRKENRVSIDTWETLILDSVCESIYDGDHMPPPKSESGIPFLMISNVNDGYLSFENTRYVPEDYYNSLSKTRKPQKGDVLYTLVGSYGIPVVVDSDKSFCFQRHMGLLKPRKVDTYYLWYQLQSDVIYQKATAIATGTAQLTVPIKGLRKIEIAVPTMEEQQEIVRILNDVLGKERKLQEDITGIIEQVESARKSILAKAFRGELGTNDPEDECAIELLKGILDDTREN